MDSAKNPYTSSGATNGGRSHPMAALNAAISSAPRGDPCDAEVSCFVGAPYAMWVRARINDGWSSAATASSIASAMAARS